MPARAASLRAQMLAYLSGLHHRRFIDMNADGLLQAVYASFEKQELSKKDAALIRELWRDYTLATKLPAEFVEEFAAATSHAQLAWAQARKDNNFAHFRPHLENIVALSRTKAAYLGSESKPYDALLDTYEPGMTADELSITFAELKVGLVSLIQRIAHAKAARARAPKGVFPQRDQEAFLAFVNEKLGFDATAGRLDISTHPFTTGTHPLDVRITTRYDEKDPWYAIGSNIHEVGHALYEQGLPDTEAGTPLGEAVSLGVHESQSRFWENMIGKNMHTWKYFFPRLKKQFPAPLRTYTLDHWYRFINDVRPSRIRTEADEVTYNVHIIIRFEIEKELIEGTIKVKNLPEIWNQKMKDYLGVTVTKDSDGVLQDVHWSAGLIGYFPTYTLGNLYSAQLYYALLRDMPQFDAYLRKGQFQPIREWLKTNIHRHGRLYSAGELMQRATGSPLSVAPFLTYLTEKYSALYNLRS